ncbi:DUF2231 domain-containing protein [soil metagenome]
MTEDAQASDLPTDFRRTDIPPAPPRPAVAVAGHSIHNFLVPIPIGCFVAAFLTDILYWASLGHVWANASIWLITVGLICAGIAVLVGLIDFAVNREFRRISFGWPHVIASVLVIALSLLNAFVHSRDGYTAVVPQGIALSAVVVLIVIVTGWTGWHMAHDEARKAN